MSHITFKSFKNREIDYTKKVDVYRNLNRKGKVYSIRQGGYVIGHSDSYLHLEECEFIINKSAKSKVIESKERSVHAFVRGYLRESGFNPSAFISEVKYNPFVSDGFVLNNGMEVTSSKRFFIINGLCFIEK